MRLLIQRVSHAQVRSEGRVLGEIDRGLLVFLGIGPQDDRTDIDWLVSKLLQLRIFTDEAGKMNHSVKDVEGEVLVVSQFTLHASTRKGNRPSYAAAAPPELAIPLYEAFVAQLRSSHTRKVATGEFGASMQVSLENDGPVTIWIDSRNRE